MSFEIGKNIETREPFFLNVKDVVASRTYIASETRFGKSHTARRIVEEILENWVGQVGVIIIDPEGEFSSLREKYSVIIIGRDVPIQVETPTLLASTAEFMAQQVLEAGASVIIDVSVVEDVESGKDYVDKFLRRFFHLQTTAKKPYLVLWEEIEDFAPESGAPGTRTCLETAIAYARRGGKRGIGVIFVGHRPAWISKGILAQTPNKAIGRIESPDMKALEEYARIPRNIVEKLIPKTNEKGEVTDPGPERGVFCFTGDWVQKTTFVKVGPVRTTHIGSTPEIIPRPVGDIEGVIANVQKALSQVIEKAKPVIASQTEIESKIKTELESKYKGKIETLERTAVERAERKYRVKIDELQGQLEKLSRSQAMQPTAPITDVLEHPIVKARMLQLDEKTRDLLTWIERESGHTREELAARMVSSKDVVASMVDKINRVFQLQVLVDDGRRPIRYKSILKRVFLTDVAKREIEELERLQADNKAKTGRVTELENQVQSLTVAGQQNTTLRGDVQRLTEELGKKTLECTSLEALTEELGKKVDALAKENEAYRKIKEGFLALGVTASPTPISASIDWEKLTVLMEQKMKETINEEKIKELVKEFVQLSVPAGSGVVPTSVELEHKVTHFDFQKREEHVKADTTTLQGRILYTILKDPSFWEKRHNPPEVTTKLGTYGWTHNTKDEVSPALVELCQKGILTRVLSTGNYWWYSLQSEAKEQIHA